MCLARVWAPGAFVDFAKQVEENIPTFAFTRTPLMDPSSLPPAGSKLGLLELLLEGQTWLPPQKFLKYWCEGEVGDHASVGGNGKTASVTVVFVGAERRATPFALLLCVSWHPQELVALGPALFRVPIPPRVQKPGGWCGKRDP